MATIAAFLATAVPILGIIFILLGAPYWPILLLNVGFVMMALDGVLSRTRILLLLPLIWFGGYTALALASHWQVAQLRSTANELNQQLGLSWKPGSQSLLIQKDDTSSENYASDIKPDDLVLVYGLDQAYGGSFADAPRSHVWLDRNACPERGISVSGNRQYHPISRNGYPRTKGPMQWAQGVCLIFERDGPTPPNPLRVRLLPVQPLKGLVDGISQEIQIESMGSPTRRLMAMQAAPLPWLPMPILGCHYKGGFGDAWDRGCHSEFGFTSWRDSPTETPMAVLARALQLRPTTIEQRLSGVDWK